jgi:hypothetical protein
MASELQHRATNVAGSTTFGDTVEISGDPLKIHLPAREEPDFKIVIPVVSGPQGCSKIPHTRRECSSEAERGSSPLQRLNLQIGCSRV